MAEFYNYCVPPPAIAPRSTVDYSLTNNDAASTLLIPNTKSKMMSTVTILGCNLVSKYRSQSKTLTRFPSEAKQLTISGNLTGRSQTLIGKINLSQITMMSSDNQMGSTIPMFNNNLNMGLRAIFDIFEKNFNNFGVKVSGNIEYEVLFKNLKR
jgi:hypothetical protein